MIKKKSKRSKKFELLIKTTEVIMFNQTKIKKTKRKSSNPTLGGASQTFLERNSKEKKVRKQAQVILSLEIP
jgi:hypothetical protein